MDRYIQQWFGTVGAYDYDASQDALRLEIPVQQAAEVYEPFTIMFNEEGTELTMVWNRTKVVLPIRL